MASQSSAQSVHDFTVKDARENDVDLSIYKGKVLLIVNVASQCGLTNSNYTELTQLYDKYRDQGLEILAFPCNQFGSQEPGSNEQIVEFACTRFKADYPIFDKVDVNGKNAAPIYKFLKSSKGGLFGDSIKWNFSKFLVDKDGKVVDRYAPTTSPLSIEYDGQTDRQTGTCDVRTQSAKVKTQNRSSSMATQTSKNPESVHDFTIKDAKENDVDLSIFKGKVLLIVNIASKCGLTNSNYAELNQLYEKYKDQGLEILAFPCNQFGEQEPGTNDQITDFVCTRFKSEFPIFDKIDVNGENASPLYKFLKLGKWGIFGDDIQWNFAKFLVSKDGQVVGRYYPTTSPLSLESPPPPPNQNYDGHTDRQTGTCDVRTQSAKVKTQNSCFTLLPLLHLLLSASLASSMATQTSKNPESVYDFTIKDAKENDVDLSIFKGKVLLIVNVASKCGMTNSNYAELNQLYEKYKDQGLEILAFPCNQFGEEEPGTNDQITDFVCTRFKSEFPIFDKIDVNGENASPLYKFLKLGKWGIFGDDIQWNFAKFLVSKDGQVVGRYYPTTSPLSLENNE
ncbi:glutathione peroxidase 6 [Populus alba x Populus x berolinensis]|uniref:Glutathione peroxidase n=1 Tax=Populus alba x Populus x berolinensis TaxID=444605 RepID=A0AAD6WFA7_9ROSI|nr:glutathione peroxidase 6 [Populus alba x Populus x berolinensis]